MIVKLAVKAKSLEEQLAVSLKTQDAQGQLEGPSTKDAIISAQEEYLAVKDIKLARQDNTIAKLTADLARADDTISQLQSKSADAEVPPPTESFSTTTTPPAPHAPLQEQMLDAVVDENARLYTQVADLQQQVDTLMDEAIIRSWESNAQEGEWMAREKDMRGLICSLYSIIQESGLAPTSSPSSSPSSSGSANSSATLVDEPTTSCASPCTTEAAVSGQDEQDLEEQQETVLSTSASSILRSGQLLASDSLANVVTSSSSEMLFKMAFDILEDISFTSEVTEPTSSLTSSSSADVQAVLPCESTSTVQQDGSEEEAPVIPASTSAILRSGQVLASDSLQGIVLSISSEMLFNVDFDLLEDMSFTAEDTETTASLTSSRSADVQAALPCESTSTVQQDGSEEEAPVLPASTSAILRSGQILASDSLQGIVLSISSEMLFNVDFDLPADTSFVLFASTTSSESSLAPASSSHIMASITADMLSNVTLDLPPATPCARRSSGPLAESPMKMVVSSSSQLLSRVTFDLPPSSPG
ncbi:hypothetical protein K466DRAFT_371362 [Polyporus arcularius HHB13444]|uniref:Uncharacterized protein n=1 Tax=Polyporus arcularius HHB13444 TaxID=1314778 RepID=A0A5C3NTP8_9APHY|nr:hypothetical protein K466DRAFT_371362 [Polyporus arcularius HHB13444]